MARCSIGFRIAMVLLCAVGGSRAWSAEADDVDAYVESERQAQRIPGLALLVIKDGQTIKARGYGLANVEHQVPVKPETIFQSGSMGKQFTATAVMMLVEEGRMALDDPATKYLPDAPKTWKKVTVRQLLSHTSGLKNYPDDFDLRDDYTEEELLQVIYSLPFVFEPGEQSAYSNPGYATLGILIHKVTGQFYGDFLQERIFKPLGMTSTRIISEEDIIPNRAAGYHLINGQLKNQDWVSPSLNTTAEGSLYFNILDLAKWDAALNGTRLLKKSSLEKMWTPARLNNGLSNRGGYGFGWVRDQVRGHAVIEHEGAWQGFSSHISRYVDDRLTVVVLTNLSADSFAGPLEIVRHVAGLYVAALVPEEAAKSKPRRLRNPVPAKAQEKTGQP
jgi:CubicO group peptidase (beta-lactamase class C family)